ncbi:MAG: hypothetical protein HOW73_36295 [Polyangiaceae bacterium]|nr:hypothetical protein [Polyangiaceae bacterium]
MSEPSSQRFISLTLSLDDCFREPVTEAVRGRGVETTPATESYLVQLLTEFAKPSVQTTSPLTQPVTFLLRDAMNASGQERFKRLQALGDGVLYGLGFFSDTMKGADEDYVAQVGSSAYEHAARMLQTGQRQVGGPNVLGELATKFDCFVAVLRDVSDWFSAKAAHDEEALVRLYERWLKTGSTVLQGELGQRGLLPLRNPGGVH